MAKKNYIGQLLTGGQPSGNTSKNNKTGTSGIYGTVSMPSGIGSTVKVNTTSNPANVGSLSSATSVIPPKPPVTAIQPSNLTTTTGAITNSVLKNILANSIASTPTQNSTPTQPSTGTPPTATPAQSTTPYADANANIADMIRQNAESQIASATSRKEDALNTLETNYNNWITGQSELRDAYLKQMAEKEGLSKTASNANYDRTATQNYINYRQAEKRLPSQLNALGVRGGAAESSLIRLGSNYGTNVANNEMARAQALDAISQQYADTINEYETQYRQAILARDDAKATQIAQYLDSWNKELSDIEAAKNDALTNAYATATENDIAYAERMAQIEREAKQREEDIARATKEREEDIARAIKEREEDLARDDKIRAEDLALAAKQDKYEKEKYEKEYKDQQLKDMLEQYASGLARWSIETLKKMRANITKNKGWRNDPFKYGQVRAIDTQIGLKQDKK